MRSSRRLAALGVIALVAFSSSISASARADGTAPSPQAQAQHDKAKELIRITIRVLERRVGELERTMAYDNRESKELQNHAALRDHTADEQAARAKDYRAILALLPPTDPMRAQLDTIASALESGAAHDHDFATQRRAAAKILTDQAAQSAEFIRLDKISIESYRKML